MTLADIVYLIGLIAVGFLPLTLPIAVAYLFYRALRKPLIRLFPDFKLSDAEEVADMVAGLAGLVTLLAAAWVMNIKIRPEGPVGYYWAAFGFEVGAIAAMLLMGVLYKKGKNRRVGELGEEGVKLLLVRRKIPALHGVYVSGAGRSVVQPDHMAKIGASIVTIETKFWIGEIDCDETRDTWDIRYFGGEQVKQFRNPLNQAYWHRKNVAEIIGSASIVNLVVFMGHPKFKRDLPNGAMTKDDFEDFIIEKSKAEPSTPENDAAWARLVAYAEQSNQAALKERHTANFQRGNRFIETGGAPVVDKPKPTSAPRRVSPIAVPKTDGAEAG